MLMVVHLIFLLPSLAALITGMVLTGRARREHGKAATYGMIGCALLMVNLLIEAGWSIAIPMLVDSMGVGGLGLVSAASSILGAALFCGGVGLLIWGVVARRGPAAPPPPPGWYQQH